MKPTIPLFVCMFVCVLAAGTAFAQDPSIIQNTRAKMNTVRDKETAQSNEALGNLGMPNSAQAATPGNTAASQNAVPASTTAHATTKAHAATKAHATAKVQGAAQVSATKVPATAKAPLAAAVKTEATSGDEDAASATNVAANGKKRSFCKSCGEQWGNFVKLLDREEVPGNRHHQSQGRHQVGKRFYRRSQQQRE